MTEAAETVDLRQSDKPGGASILVTCDHASEVLPRPFAWSEADKRLLGTHWASDLGAADFSRELAAELGSVAVLSRFSRLLVDPNRPLASSTLMRAIADGRPIELNQALSGPDKDWRLWRYYLPYHLALGRAANAVEPALILAVHSFTRNYEGELRPFELGVLCSTHDALATAMTQQLRAAGYNARLNEPWSGKEGFMFAADSLAVAGGPGRRKAVMLELRNDLATDPAWRKPLVQALCDILYNVGGAQRPAAAEVAAVSATSAR